MASTLTPRPGAGGAGASSAAQQPADVLVIFGITGDLAKVMTFTSLYRLERRGLLDCPIVGVAVDEGTAGDLRNHARIAITASGEEGGGGGFERLANPPSYRAGGLGGPPPPRRGGGGGSGRLPKPACPTWRVTSGPRRPTSGCRRRSAARGRRCSTSRSRRSCSDAS